MSDALADPIQQAGDADAPRSWREAIAVLIGGLAVLALATVSGVTASELFDRWADVDTPRAYPPGAHADLTTVRLAIFLAAFQVTAVALTYAIARNFRGDRVAVMALGRPVGGATDIVKSVAMLLALAGAYGASVYVFDRKPLLGDVQLFADMMRSGTWWMIVVTAVIGAPLAEETLFRGLMYGVLRSSPVGKVGAAMVTSVVWASVHAQYSNYGLAAIFLIGLYLAFVRERSGSLIVPIACHAAYNGAIVLALMLAPQSVFQT